MMDSVEKTRQTYDQIAERYAEVRADGHAMVQHVARFAKLLPVGGLVADIGCGPAHDSRLLQQQGLRVVGVDFSLGMLRVAQARPSCPLLVQADMRWLPFAPRFAGLWLCASLLHIPRAETPAVLAACQRLLLPGGMLLVSVKGGEGEAWTAQSYGQAASRFFTFWQPAALDDLLKTAAFTIVDGWQQREDKVTWLTRICQKGTTLA